MPGLLRWLVMFAALAVWPGMAAAQNWQLHTHDDGSFFLAQIHAGPALSLLCGGKSPQWLNPYQTGNLEPEITAPGVLRLGFDPHSVGLPQGGYEPARGDIVLVAAGQGFRLPNAVWNDLTYSWQADVTAADPLFTALASGGAIEVHSRAGRLALTGAGFAEVFGRMTAYCQRRFAATGQAWPGASAPPPQGAATAPGSAAGVMAQAAETAIAKGCNGPAARAAGYLLAGNIDGDGREDIVLDWNRISCLSGHPRPFCGAALCSADVFLTARFARQPQPIGLLALGVRLQPLSNGNMAVATGGSLAMCQGRGASACEFLYWWNGADLVELF